MSDKFVKLGKRLTGPTKTIKGHMSALRRLVLTFSAKSFSPHPRGTLHPRVAGYRDSLAGAAAEADVPRGWGWVVN